MKRGIIGGASLGAMLAAGVASAFHVPYEGLSREPRPMPRVKWHDVRTYYRDGVHLVRGFTKTKPHYRVEAEGRRRRAQNKARMTMQRNRKHGAAFG